MTKSNRVLIAMARAMFVVSFVSGAIAAADAGLIALSAWSACWGWVCMMLVGTIKIYGE